ncbi:hypothetical protein [Tropheryma whipplei]|uniref:hypothetical protein n=1 Tax=Tropheryma whipplei TaxID=2039 RepID=UPI00053A4DED|nr:hypothetical protein [Tropheryma whipplei]
MIVLQFRVFTIIIILGRRKVLPGLKSQRYEYYRALLPIMSLYICVELRPLSCGRALLTCADGAHLILDTSVGEVESMLRKATAKQSPGPLGVKL